MWNYYANVSNRYLPPEHWKKVLRILTEALDDAGYSSGIVSITDEATVIQKTIIQNIYESDIVVCDISARNPNVMFELGMRLTFDKATVIIKDEQTVNPFDTSIIEYVQYSRSLEYYDVIDFKERLKMKVQATLKASKEPNYSTFVVMSLADLGLPIKRHW